MTVTSIERVRLLADVAIEDIESRPDYLSRWASEAVQALSPRGAAYKSFV